MDRITNTRSKVWRPFAITLVAFAVVGVGTRVLAHDTSVVLERLITHYHALGQFNGAILAAHDGEVVFKQGYGEANREWENRNGTDTKFRLGSVTKTFTAVLVMNLVDDGLITLDQTISHYLPDFRTDVGTEVTVHHLLTHSSGIALPSMSMEEYWDIFQRRLTTEEILTTLCSGDPRFSPGEKFSYSSAGYMVLGAIIEAVTGQTYGDALRERVLAPARMLDTGIDDPELILRHRATGYQTNYGLGKARYKYMPSSFSSGALYSTVADLYRFHTTLGTDLILSEGSRRKMFERHITSHRGYYGYGWFVADWKVGDTLIPVAFHAGDVSGFSAFILQSLQGDDFVVLLSNQEGLMYYDIAANVLAVLHGYSPEEPKAYVADLLRRAMLSGGLDEGRRVYGDIQARGLDQYDTDENELIELAYDLLAIEKCAESIAVFEICVAVHGASPDVYTGLGEAHHACGDLGTAVECYRSVIELDTGNKNAAAMIKRLSDELSSRSHSKDNSVQR